MTKKIIAGHAVFLLLALSVIGSPAAEASEVVGTLSSDTSSTNTSGSLSGTVSQDDSGGSSSGGRRGGRGGGGSSNASTPPPGAVLGVATNAALTPGFPNAGVEPVEARRLSTLWFEVVSHVRNFLSL